VSLARLIDELIGTAGQLAEKNQNRLVVEAQESVGVFNADPMRLKQSLLNLLSRSTATWTFFTLRLGTESTGLPRER